MKTTSPLQTERKADGDWVKTPHSNLLRCKSSGAYFGRVRVNGKLIRRFLETHVLTVAKLKFSGFLQDHRRLAINKGQAVNGEVIIEMLKKEIEDDPNNKPRMKCYTQEVLIRRRKNPGRSCILRTSPKSPRKIATIGRRVKARVSASYQSARRRTPLPLLSACAILSACPEALAAPLKKQSFQGKGEQACREPWFWRSMCLT